MTDIVIKKLNETFMSVVCAEQHMEYELQDAFSFKVKNSEHDPRVKAGKWDGIKRLYNRVHKRMHVGLLIELMKFIAKQKYTYTLDPSLIPSSSISLEDVSRIINDEIRPHDKNKPLEPYEYQINATHHMLNSGRSICLAATSSGKSLILYNTVRLYQLSGVEQMFIIVPSMMLVDQLYADFVNYSTFEGARWQAQSFCQRFSSDHKGPINKQIVITTWQSLKKIPSWMITDAGAIFIDEAHTIKGPVLAGFLESAVNCPIRHGMTGTLNGMECDELEAQGHLGPKKVIVTAKENIEAGRATRVNVNMVILDYDEDTKRMCSAIKMSTPKNLGPSGQYNAEVEFINSLESRRELLYKTVNTLKGNTIVLFDRVEGHGMQMYESMKAERDNVFLIVGEVKGAERERIKNMLENIDGAVVFATTSLMSTGVSIKNLHNMIFAASSKSIIRVLQSIGRLMRLHESKKYAQLIDFVDKLDFKGVANFTLSHCEERIKMYVKEGHKVKVTTLKMREPKQKPA